MGSRNERSVLSTELISSNIKKSKADFTVREIYFFNISKVMAFLPQGEDIFQTDPMAKRRYNLKQLQSYINKNITI